MTKNQTLETTMTNCWTQEFHSHKAYVLQNKIWH